MKCPSCRYVSFEHLSRCKKCGLDLTQIKEEARIDFPHSMRLGLLTRSETGGGGLNVDALFEHGGARDDTGILSREGSGFNGVASAELGTDGLGSVGKNSAGKIPLDHVVEDKEEEVIGLEPEELVEMVSGAGESPPSEIREEGAERVEIAFDSSALEGLGEETAGSGPAGSPSMFRANRNSALTGMSAV